MSLDNIDRSLIFSLKEGDEEAFRELYLRFYKAINYYINQYVNDSAVSEDLTQESFFYLWQNKERLDISKSCKAYLFSIARSNALNFLRDVRYDKRYRHVIDMQIKQDEVWENIFRKDILSKVNLEINRLPDKQKEVMVLSRKRYLSNKEIAQKLQISIKTVEYRLMLALRQLRKNIT